MDQYGICYTDKVARLADILNIEDEKRRELRLTPRFIV